MPNIAIYEGGKAARMNGVSRITTDDGNDGKIEWVPQSERQTGTLYVSENGTYRAEDEGLHSWSKVTVRLAGAPLGLEVPTLPDPVTGAEIPTGEEGELEPVAPAGLEPIEDEPISADEAESILEDTEFDPSDLDPDSPNYDDAMEAIADALGTDPEDVKVIDPEKKEDVKKEQPKVEDKGQVIAGTDPETGETVEVTPSGKESKEPEPVAIVITKLPNLGPYNDGDRLSFGGIEVRLYSKYEEYEEDGRTHIDAEPYRSSRYPEGVIPFGELVFPVKVASCDETAPAEYGGYPAITSGAFYGNMYNKYLQMWRTYVISSDNGDPILVGYGSWGYYDRIDLVSLGSFTVSYMGPDNPLPTSTVTTRTERRTAGAGGYAAYSIQCEQGINGSGKFGNNVDLYNALTAGDVTHGQTVPVEWVSPSGKTLRTEYTVQVRPNKD